MAKIVTAGTITLQPIIMVWPNSKGIHAPSRRKSPKTISQAEFLARYADYPQVIPVSYADNGISDPQPVTAYGHGLDCWYIIA